MVTTHAAELAPPVVQTEAKHVVGNTAVYLELYPFLIDLMNILLEKDPTHYVIDLMLNIPDELLRESGFYARIFKRY
ncbi:hypothetical protein [Herpetosiphon gulosus]|jgi:hypothetical protein|uniref:Uncharacterized protein n=1 Tax=Herpetosiphon gulosus TaxID=1973496 RepID=A0ABP9X7Q0_9CHLR